MIKLLSSIKKEKHMKITGHIAKQIRDLHFGGNWTWSSFREHLTGLTWQQATTEIHSFNSIATLVFHTNYYLNAVSCGLEGKSVDAKHQLSFVHPAIESQDDWESLLTTIFSDAENFAKQIEEMPEKKLWENVSEKHGNYYRNIQGVIEHNHYHLGQIVQIKKLLAKSREDATKKK
jgi:hypothetical protein